MRVVYENTAGRSRRRRNTPVTPAPNRPRAPATEPAGAESEWRTTQISLHLQKPRSVPDHTRRLAGATGSGAKQTRELAAASRSFAGLRYSRKLLCRTELTPRVGLEPGTWRLTAAGAGVIISPWTGRVVRDKEAKHEGVHPVLRAVKLPP